MVDGPRVLQLPVSYLPWTIGGKEVYTHHLSRHLRAVGWDARVVFHQNPNTCEPLGEHEHEGVPVTVLPPLPEKDYRRSVYACTPASVPGYEEFIREFRPDIVHFQDFSIGANLLHLKLAREYGARTMMTYHSPGQSCLQRSLLYRNKTVCDGEIKPIRCTSCRLGVSGVPEVLASILGALPIRFLNAEGANRLTRALTARAMTDEFTKAWAAMIAMMDKIHIPADWVTEMMVRNGVQREQLAMFRTGGPWQNGATRRISQESTETLRLVYVGRCDEVKGVHVLVEAIRKLPANYPVEVSFYGPYWETPYGQRLLLVMRGDKRFREPERIPNEQVLARIAEADLCVVPSLWLETGPLVVLEAFSAGVPVIGSRLGGIAELVRDGVDGILFPPGDSDFLSEIICGLARERDRVSSLKRHVRPPRTMFEVAQDMAALYDSLIGR